MRRTGRSAWLTSCAIASSPSRRGCRLRPADEGAAAARRADCPAPRRFGREHTARIPQTAGCALDAVTALAPANRHGQRLRRRYGKARDHLFTFLDHPEVAADNNGSERELRPTATYRKVTGGFRSDWGADLFAAVRSVIGTAARLRSR